MGGHGADGWDSVANKEEPVDARLEDHGLEREWAEEGIENDAQRAMCTYPSLQHVQHKAFCGTSLFPGCSDAFICSPDQCLPIIGSLSSASASVHRNHQIVHEEHRVSMNSEALSKIMMPR